MARAQQLTRWKIPPDPPARKTQTPLSPSGRWARVWRFLMRPGWRNLPLALLLVCIIGAVPGPPASLFVAWVLDVRMERVFKDTYTMLAVTCLGGACHALCIYLLCILPLEYLRPSLQRHSKPVTYAAVLGGAILGASSGFLLASTVRDLLRGARVPLAAPPFVRLTVLSLLIALGVTLLVVIVRTVVAESEIREHVLAEAAALAQAHALQAQINPHFFFNTLTTISALAELDSRAARELVGDLAQLFRYTLSCSQFEMVTMEQELEFVANYLRIEQARFRRRLHFELPPAGAGRGILLPGLTLQPLVENAIRHGIARRREGGTIKVNLECSESVCVLSVANPVALEEDLPALTGEQVFRPGHSLSNTRDRLALAFHGRAGIELVNDGTDWIKVVATFPVWNGKS
jgi:Histidine kinase